MKNSLSLLVQHALNASSFTPTSKRVSSILLTLFFVSSTLILKAQPWTQLSITPTLTDHVQGLHFVNDKVGYIAGIGGFIRKTTDGGATWTAQTSNTTDNFAAMYFIDAMTGFAVGDNGLVRRTEDGGTNWKIVNTPTPTSFFRDVWFLNAYVGYIAGGISGAAGTILKTIDGGKTWNIDISPSNGQVIYSVFFTSENDGYACDYDGRIMKTADGGSTWNGTTTFIAPNNHLGGIYFIDASTGYVVGGDRSTNTGILLKTTNAGGNWTPVTTIPTNNFFTEIAFWGNTGFIVGGNVINNSYGVIYKTTNGGINWTPETISPLSPGSARRLVRISLPCSHTGYASGLDGTVLKIEGINAAVCCDSFYNSFLNTNFTYAVTPPSTVYTFNVPAGTISGDIFSWNFGDGQTATSAVLTETHAYATVGNYLVTLYIQRPQANGDTCKVKLCQLIKVSTCPNLITNGDFELGDDGSFTTFLNQDLIGACATGAYYISNDFQNKCGLWPTSGDHTTGSGNFMSVDGVAGGTGPFEVWRTNNISIQANTTYKFSFWVKSVYPFAQQKQLSVDMFIEDGTVSGSGSTIISQPNPINQTPPKWTKYSMIWNSGAKTSINLVIKQKTASDFQDFGIDDISFSCIDCCDFMTDVMDFGIQGNGVSGNTYQFCLSPNISSNDIVQWDLDCDGTIDTPLSSSSNNCATFTLTAANTQICATVLHIIDGDTCRVKVNACLPDFEPIDTCSCESPYFENDVNAGFTWVESAPYTVTLTPVSLQDNCDSVKWILGTGGIAGTTTGNASLTYTYPSTPGSYQVCMIVTRTDANGNICTKEFCLDINLSGVVGLTEVALPSLRIQPNPTQNLVFISSIPATLQNHQNFLRLTTIEGRVVKSILVESTEMSINLDMLPAGLYFLSVCNNKGNILTRPNKLVKQ